MPLPLHDFAKAALPNLTADNYRITSASSWKYNCIAWAVSITDSWWWPVPGRYWPPNVNRKETIDAFIAALGTLGFSPCPNPDLQSGITKVSLYASASIPTHAARQLADGWWTSKLGPSFDIEHADLEAVAGGVYGSPVAFLSKLVAT